MFFDEPTIEQSQKILTDVQEMGWLLHFKTCHTFELQRGSIRLKLFFVEDIFSGQIMINEFTTRVDIGKHDYSFRTLDRGIHQMLILVEDELTKLKDNLGV